MKLRYLLLPSLILLSLLLDNAHGQGRLPSQYVPARPTISPYFAYSAINTTGLPNYYTYIQPLQQQSQLGYLALPASRAPLAYDGRMTLTESSLSELLDRQLRQRLTTGGGAPATASTFQNYSHFYPSLAPSPGRR